MSKKSRVKKMMMKKKKLKMMKKKEEKDKKKYTTKVKIFNFQVIIFILKTLFLKRIIIKKELK